MTSPWVVLVSCVDCGAQLSDNGWELHARLPEVLCLCRSIVLPFPLGNPKPDLCCYASPDLHEHVWDTEIHLTIMNLWNCLRGTQKSDVHVRSQSLDNDRILFAPQCQSLQLWFSQNPSDWNWTGSQMGHYWDYGRWCHFWIEHRRVMSACLELEWMIWEKWGDRADLHKSQ